MADQNDSAVHTAQNMTPPAPDETEDDRLERYGRDFIDDQRASDPNRAKATAQQMDSQGLRKFFGVKDNSPQILADQPKPATPKPATPKPVSVVSCGSGIPYTQCAQPTSSGLATSKPATPHQPATSHWSGH
jgi:hypothetical protein